MADEYEPIDPAALAAIRASLDRYQGLVDRVRATHGRIEPGSLAAEDDELAEARFVRLHASQAAFNALDHLVAWKLLISGELIPVQAQFTLLRGVFEGSVRARWLVDAGVPSGIRVARGWAAKRDDFTERRKFENVPKPPGYQPGERSGLSAADRLAELDERQREACIWPEPYADTTALMRKYDLEGLYRLTSGFAHGKEWVMAAHEMRPGEDQPEADEVSGTVQASSDLLLGLTRQSVVAIDEAVGDIERYYRRRS